MLLHKEEKDEKYDKCLWVWKWQDLEKELIRSDEWHLRGERRLWISVKVAGLKLDKYGGMIGKR